jgi:hypothetical protein
MTKRLLVSLASSACLVAAGACADSPIEIATTPLAGTVGGMPWTFQTGETSAFLSEGEPDFFASLYASSFTACAAFPPSGPHLLVSVPKQVGDYEMGLGRNMTFVDRDSNNLITFDGRIVVDEVTATTVTGGLHATYDGGNSVDGRFQITICPED